MDLGSDPRSYIKLAVVTDTCETSTGKVETDRFMGFTGQPSLVGEL